MRAVIDRIVDGRALIIAESESEPASEAIEINIDVAQLPEAAKAGDWLIINEQLLVQKDESQIELEQKNGCHIRLEQAAIELDPDTTEQVRSRISDKLNAIRSKSTGSKFA